ncbi:MAG: DUF4870 domain-containing protein [Phycisphaerales bacterium]|nr:DUF4870 domain-containing protein [Phycisphaerales bacterium]
MNASEMSAGSSDRIRVVEPNATDDDRLWATFIHLSGLAGYLIPMASIIAPLVLWLIKKSQSPFLDDHGREALNFQISMVVWGLVAGVLCFVCIGVVLLPVVVIVQVVFSIVMAVRANRGEYVRYPITIRFLS